MRFTWFKLAAFVLISSGAAFAQCTVPPCTNIDKQVQGSRWPAFGTDSGSANAYVVATIASMGPGLRTGSKIMFFAANGNTTTSTLNVDSTGVKTIKKWSAGSISDLSSGDISTGQLVEVVYDGTYYQAVGGMGGGSGTVTTFSAGNLSPLFTTSVANATTTPALSFSLSNAAAHSFFGNNTGSTAAPGFQAIGTGDLPGNGATTVLGTTCTLGSSCSPTSSLTTNVSGILPVANGGTGTASPSIVAGTNVTVSGSWPNQTVSSTASTTINNISCPLGGSCTTSGPGYGAFYCAVPNSGSSTSVQCNTLTNIIPHQLIVATCSYYTGSSSGTDTMTISDTGPGGGSPLTWNTIVNFFDSTRQERVAAFWADPGSASGADTLKCNSSSSMSFWEATFSEVVNANLSSPADATNSGTGSSGYSNLPLTTTSSNDIAFYVSMNQTNVPTLVGMTTVASDGSIAAGIGYRYLGSAGDYPMQVNNPGTWQAVSFAIH